MSMQEIQEDLETFFRQGQIINREQVIGDLKVREDLDNLNLNEWWDSFEVNETQIGELEKLEKRLKELENELKQYASLEVKNGQKVLLNEIEENLKRIRELKTPK